MPGWTSSLVDAVTAQLEAHSYWGPRLTKAVPSSPDGHKVHLGIFVEPFLRFVLDGTKTVESRFSTYRCAPYEAVQAGDALLLKRSSGPIIAVAEVSKVWYYELDSQSWDTIKTRFGPLLRIEDPAFWTRKASSCFATLMLLERVEQFSPVSCLKKDRRGWVVLDRLETSPLRKP
jgi:hypothetical protein